MDRDDDLIVGIKSTAILFGDLDRLMICVLQSLALGTWFLLGVSLDYQNVFYIGLIAVTGLFAYQQHLIRDRSREGCFAAFKNNIWVGVTLLTSTLIEVTVG